MEDRINDTPGFIDRYCTGCNTYFTIKNNSSSKRKEHCSLRCYQRIRSRLPSVKEYQKALKLKNWEKLQEYRRKYYGVKGARQSSIMYSKYLKADKDTQEMIKKLLNIK